MDGSSQCENKIRAEFGEGDATKQKSVKRSAFSLNEGRAFSERRLGKELYRKGDSLKRFRPFSESLDSENRVLLTNNFPNFGTEKTMTATDVTGFYGFFSAWKSGNFLLILGPLPY